MLQEQTMISKQPGFRERLAGGTFPIVVELVPWAGAINDQAGRIPLQTARSLAADSRVAALSVTDNAGGHIRLGPVATGEALLGLGHDVIVHVACRDRNRSGLLSLGWDLLGRGLTNVLAVSGDYPADDLGGLSRPVFDIDSSALLHMYAGLGSQEPDGGARGDGQDMRDGHRLFLGAVVNPYKRYERELIPQYLKLEMKVRTGASFVISQLGYDSRKADELLRYLELRDLRVPVLANVYILNRGVARAFRDGRIAGCVITDELMAIVERESASADHGRAFFLEFAARQVAVARGLGYAGVYLAGHRSAAEIERVLDGADRFEPEDWMSFARQIRYSHPDAFSYFEPDPETGLNRAEVNLAYAASLRPAGRRRARRGVPLGYRFDRLTHRLAFRPGSEGFKAGTSFYQGAERLRLGRPLHILEQAVKIPLFDCRDCGDCSLPEIAYLCPESQCVKNQRNGPCGGSNDGQCEVPDRVCIWAAAYERLKPFGEELRMLERPVIVQDNALRRTSAWANTYLGRDHSGRASPSEPGAKP
jgi:methylenetetrahydrofolate reductase (NADPH)